MVAKKVKPLVRSYSSSWWLPILTALVALVAFAISGLGRLSGILVNSLLAGVALALFGILIAAAWNLYQRRWLTGLANLASFPILSLALLYVIAAIIATVIFGPSEDGFADHLTIPSNLDVAEPLGELRSAPGDAEDTFQAAMLEALRQPGSDGPTITADVHALVALQEKAPAILRRYLVTSPAWRVFEERGSLFATRRWKIGSMWHYKLHGYYSEDDIDSWSENRLARFQCRFTLGLSGKPWVSRIQENFTQMQAGETKSAKRSGLTDLDESFCLINADDLVVEIFEQTFQPERRLTKRALDYLNRELEPLVELPNWDTIRGLLPPSAIRRGEPSLELRNSFQPGLYDSEVWVNPGESGRVYLKAFEVTRGSPLSVRPLETYSNEWVGWSDDPAELFLSNTHFTIYEGDWGKPYAARFEVWFVPDAGSKERKLLEKVFKIEGWQR